MSDIKDYADQILELFSRYDTDFTFARYETIRLLEELQTDVEWEASNSSTAYDDGFREGQLQADYDLEDKTIHLEKRAYDNGYNDGHAVGYEEGFEAYSRLPL